MTVGPGKIYRTPFEPSGLFRVDRLCLGHSGPESTAFGTFIGDHPKGYKNGEHGKYPVRELEGREVPIAPALAETAIHLHAAVEAATKVPDPTWHRFLAAVEISVLEHLQAAAKP